MVAESTFPVSIVTESLPVVREESIQVYGDERAPGRERQLSENSVGKESARQTRSPGDGMSRMVENTIDVSPARRVPRGMIVDIMI